MRKRGQLPWKFVVAFAAMAVLSSPGVMKAQTVDSGAKTRLAIVGLDHDHVWSLLKDVAREPSAELIAIAESDSALINQARKEVPASVKFYSDYVAMLDEAKPEAVIVATSNDRHLEILRQCAKRHIHYSRWNGWRGKQTSS